MKKVWRATDDERLMAESGRIYRVGFWVLAVGILLDVLIWGLLAALFVLGAVLGCRSWRQYRPILRHSGRAVADFTALDGPGPTFVNMALTGMLGLLYLRWMRVDLNGPMLCCIFSLVGFAAFGKHPRNVIPVALGAVASSRLRPMLSPQAARTAGAICTTVTRSLSLR